MYKVPVGIRLLLKMMLPADNTRDQENDIPEQIPVASEEVEQEEVGQEEVYNPPENGDVSVEEEIPVAEVVDEIPVDPEREAESDAKYEDVPKKSYAYIVSRCFSSILGSLVWSLLHTFSLLNFLQCCDIV